MQSLPCSERIDHLQPTDNGNSDTFQCGRFSGFGSISLVAYLNEPCIPGCHAFTSRSEAPTWENDQSYDKWHLHLLYACFGLWPVRCPE